jgi:hypothetical protein
MQNSESNTAAAAAGNIFGYMSRPFLMGGPFLALLCRSQFSGFVSPHVAPGPAASNKKPPAGVGLLARG